MIDPVLARSVGWAVLDRVLTESQDDFGAPSRAVFAFQVGITFVGASRFQRVRGKFRIDVARAAIGLNFEAGVGRKAERDGRTLIVNRDVLFWRIGKAQVNGAIGIVQHDFAGNVVQRNGIVFGARSQISRRVGNFQIAGGFFKVAAKLAKCQIAALGDEAHAFGNLIGANGAVKFAIDGEASGSINHFNFPTVAGDFHVALGIGNFHVSFLDGDVHIAGNVVDFDVAILGGSGNVGFHVGDGDAAALIANGDHRLFRYGHFQVDRDA